MIDAAKLKSYVERVKNLVGEQKAIGVDISEVCKEAKGDGLEPTFIRFAAREMLMDVDKRTERDEKRDLYLSALGLAVKAVESGEMSARQAAKMYGVGKSSIYKELGVHDVSTVEMTADDLGTIPNIGHNAKSVIGIPDVATWQEITAALIEHEAKVAAEKEAARIKRRAEQAARDKRNAEIDADPLTIPSHLRRQPSLSRRADV